MATRLERLVRDLVATDRPVAKASRGTVGSYVVGAPSQFGQPRVDTYSDAYGLITPERMREIVLKTPTAAACINAIVDYATGVKLLVRNRDTTKDAPALQKSFLDDLLLMPNSQTNRRRFLRTIYRDLATLGNAAIEIEPGVDGAPVANLYTLDAAKIRIDYDEHGTILGYDMMNARGIPIIGSDRKHAWTPDEIIYLGLDEQSNSPYPTSRIGQIYAPAVIEALMLNFIGARFTDSNIPYGVLDVGDLSDMEVRDAIAVWNVQAQQAGKSNLMLMPSKSGMKFIPFNGQLKDLDAPTLLRSIRGQIMGILGVTVNELGEAEDVNKSNGFNLSYTFKKRAIEPLLDSTTQTLTSHLLHRTLGFRKCEMWYEEIDSRDELLQAQIDKIYLDTGIWSMNVVRNRKGMPNTDGGEEPYVILGSNAIPVSMLPQFAKVQLAALQAVVDQTEMAIEQVRVAMATGAPSKPVKPPGKLPITRTPQPPERSTTPDAPGSSTTKYRLGNATTQPARGPVQAARNAGVRNDHGT